jgi:hypothetical protein
MVGYNKPERHRLQRLKVRIEKGLDELSRGAGEMRPARFNDIREPLQQAMKELERISNLVSDILDKPDQLVLVGSDDNDAAA